MTQTSERTWTPEDVDALRVLAPLGAREIAHRLGRTENAVRRQAARHRISLRRQAERRGRQQGLPMSATAEQHRTLALLRRELAAGTVRITDLEDRIRARLAGELCPRCVARPIAVERTGLCKRCHTDALVNSYEETLQDRADARRLGAARARKYRATETAQQEAP